MHCCAEAQNGAALQDHIYMDAMGFGMGCCCLQMTFQACSMEEARRVYDALVPVSSVMASCSSFCVFTVALSTAVTARFDRR